MPSSGRKQDDRIYEMENQTPNQEPITGGQESAPEQLPVQPEVGEQVQPAPQAPPPPPTPAPAQPPETPVIPPNAEPTPDPASQTQSAEQGPMIADDVDVIEKEWVDKAQEVVQKTEGDPHAEEEAVEDLQIDYLKKRYGLDVKKTQDE